MTKKIDENMKLYYKIWVDTIVKLQSRPQNAGLWKFFAMTFISMAMALNLVLILIAVNDLGITKSIFKISVDILPGTRIDTLLSFFVSYLLSFLLLNYFLIFYRDKYKELIKKYSSSNGKLFLKYFLGSLAALIFYFAAALLIVKM